MTTDTTTVTDGGSTTDHPAAELETIVIDPDDVVAAMRRNKRDETEQRSHVLRVTTPLAGEQTASLFVDEAHNYYPPELSAKPIHLTPETFLVGHSAGSRHPDYRDEWNYPDISEERSLFRDEVPEDEQDDEGWNEWWDTVVELWEDRVRNALQSTDEITIASQHPDIEETTVAVRIED